MDDTNCNAGESGLVSGRLEEKSQLQNINHRFSAYINAIRSKSGQEEANKLNESQQHHWAEQINHQRVTYETQLSDLRKELEKAKQEKSEADASRLKYDSMSAEFESRILSLNESMRKHNEEMVRLQVLVSDRDLELQQLRAQIAGPKVDLEACKLERDDFKKRLQETERRLTEEEHNKYDLQNQFMEFQTKCNHAMASYQQEIRSLQESLEKSRLLTLELEDVAHRHKNDNVNKLLQQAREKSEGELRAYIEETEAKHSLNISEIKMQMRADAEQLAGLLEENAKLKNELNALTLELNSTKDQLSSTESNLIIAQESAESEKKNFEIQVNKMESKLQETQDLLMLKVEELGIAQDANVPLKTEIELLRNLIEEEEKRLGIESTTPAQTLLLNQRPMTSTPMPPSSPAHSSNGRHRRPSSVPLATNGFKRGSPGLTGVDIFTSPGSSRPQTANPRSPEVPRLDIEQNGSTEMEHLEDNEMVKDLTTKSDVLPGIDNLPPPVPTPQDNRPLLPKKLPSRPASEANINYISADSGSGRDYFDAMFKDVRSQSTMYKKLTETNYGSSVQQDLVNSTASHDVKSSKSGRLWYAGSTASATGNIKLVDIDENGLYVRIHNTSATRTEDIGGCLLQQNVAGHPVAVFRFPPRTKLKPGNTTTVWSASANSAHDPPTHYAWKQLEKWGTGPECTTILCKANGQAVAWMTSAPRVSRISQAYQHASSSHYINSQEDPPVYAEEDEYGNKSRVAPFPYPKSYEAGAGNDEAAQSSPMIKREKNEQPVLQSGSLSSKTGASPLRKYTSPPTALRSSSASQSLKTKQRLSKSKMIELTTQKSARSKYGFDYMTHTPKVINYDGTVRVR